MFYWKKLKKLLLFLIKVYNRMSITNENQLKSITIKELLEDILFMGDNAVFFAYPMEGGYGFPFYIKYNIETKKYYIDIHSLNRICELVLTNKGGLQDYFY
jgi:hypothetical protein